MAPWPVALAPDLDFAFYIHHEAGRWRDDPFDPAVPGQVEAAYLEVMDRHPGSQGFLVGAEPTTPTREVVARLLALESADITVGSFNVEVPLADPIAPPDAQWLEKVSPRINADDPGLSAVAARVWLVEASSPPPPNP